MPETALDRVCSLLRQATGATGRNGQWPCPAHDDRNPSLSVSQGREGVVVHCHTGCTIDDILKALDLKKSDLFDEPLERRRNGHTRREIVDTYPYVDEDGTVLYEVVRYRPKDFRQRHPDGNGGWIWNMTGIRRVLYRLPQVLDAIASREVVYVVEGEKDADAVVRAGGVATTCPQGAGKWLPEHTATLAGYPGVVVVADRDEAGYRHATYVASELRATGATVHLAQPRNGKDVAEHLGTGLTLDDLDILLDDAINSNRPNTETILDDTFWKSRPYLTHIRDAAHSRQRSAEAVLHVVLARVSAITPYTMRLPAIVGSPKPLSYFGIVVAAPGVGKSDANAIGAELVHAPEWVVDQIPVGSGEGLIELLFEMVEQRDENDKKQVVKRQTKNQAFLFIDEGQVLGELGARNGATLLPTLRSIWTGGVLGQANANKERYRVVPALTYNYGLVLALQGTRAGALLADVDAGTPQRFGWASATDTSLPDVPTKWPGPLTWKIPDTIMGGTVLDVHDDIVKEVQAADLARQREETSVEPIDAHADLYRLKVAALLAILDDRRDVNTDDWRLAKIIKAASDSVRAGVIATLDYEAHRKEEAVTRTHTNREVASDLAKERRRIVDCAQKIKDKVEADPEQWTVGTLRRAMRYWLTAFDGGLDQAKAEGWVVEVTEPGQGAEKRSLRPGGARGR